MPRYIEIEKFLDELDKQICSYCIDEDAHCCSCGVGSARGIAKDIATADVVPKSEYDRMEKLFNDMTQEAKGYLNRIYGIRAEVAREIIDKIESVMFDRFSNIMLGEDIRLCIAELKKKYTEGTE